MSGREVVLIGHEGHVEVIGTMGQVQTPVHLVSTEDDVARLPFGPQTPVAYVTQTTLSIDDTRSIIAAMKARFADIVGPETNDICYATQNRQTAVRALCENVDLLLVVGASNSSNSNRLVEIGVSSGLPSYLVADGSGVDSAWLDGVARVGLTAGASAPEALVQDVIAALQRLHPVEIVHMDGEEEHVEFRIPAALRD
jgi:4-hydroxy-3-methylbut-2-enyl diphosphate reductase